MQRDHKSSRSPATTKDVQNRDSHSPSGDQSPSTPTKDNNHVIDEDGKDSNEGATAGARLPCPSCSETFARAEHLTRHLRKHTGEKPYVCASCGKTFSRSDSMKRHTSLHVAANRARKHNRYHRSSASSEPIDNPTNKIPTTRRSATFNCSSEEQLRDSTTSPIKFPRSQSYHMLQPSASAVDMQDGSNPTKQPHGKLDSAVMADVNWFPLGEHAQVDLSPFQLFWHRLHGRPGARNATGHNRDNSNTTSNDSPLYKLSTPDPAQDVQSKNKALHSPQSYFGINSDSSSPSVQGEPFFLGGMAPLSNRAKRLAPAAGGTTISRKRRRSTPRCSFSSVSLATSKNIAPAMYISNDAYESMLQNFRYTCTGNNTLFEPFETEDFLTLTSLDELVRFSVDHFLPTIPFIHKTTILSHQSHWTLHLALAAIGTHYRTNVDEMQVYSFNELLRRTFLALNEQNSSENEIGMVQAKVLAAIALLHGANALHEEAGKSTLQSLVSYYDRHWKLDPDPPSLMPTWKSWIAEQSTYRTAYTIWLLDCMTCYQLSTRALLDLDDTNMPLPSTENLWQISSEEEFARCGIVVNPTLKAATEILYVEKTVSSGIGEFGRLLLVHALIRQTWAKLKESQSRLSAWVPHAGDWQSVSARSMPPLNSWPPEIPSYSKWRNAACDCLDVLHWHAKSSVGSSLGYTKPTGLFLHLARVVLLSPLHTIRETATSLADSNRLSGKKAQEISSTLLKWAHADCYKARLAIVHAGALLYHVKRHPRDSFYEPSAIFLSILCLWAYGSAHARKTQASIAATSEAANFDDSQLPAFIHLDRPCDDELIQLFVAHGNKIAPNITGVGDLCAPEGPGKILALGSSRLRFARNWDPQGKYESILSRLKESTTDLDQQISKPET